MMARWLIALLTLVLLSGAAFAQSITIYGPGPAPTAAAFSTLPGLPQHFALGVQQAVGDTWVPNSGGAPWDFSYTYFNDNWYTNNGGSGAMVSAWISNNLSQGTIPAITAYYGTVEGTNTFGGGCSILPWFTSASTMGGARGTNTGYWDQTALLLQLIAAATSEHVVVDIEPDFWGCLQQQGGISGTPGACGTTGSLQTDDPTKVPICVGGATSFPHDPNSSVWTTFPNTAQGFVQGWVYLRNQLAPNVYLAFHTSVWALNNGYTADQSDPGFTNSHNAGTRIGNFFNGLSGSQGQLDLIESETSDRDSAYGNAGVYNAGTYSNATSIAKWWNSTAFENFRQFLNSIHTTTGKYIMLWQMPIGNTLYRSVNNSAGHWQDDRVEFFLPPPQTLPTGWPGTSPLYASGNIANYNAAGVVGILIGGGVQYVGCGTNCTTDQEDYIGDGTTNPTALSFGSPVNTGATNSATATVSDDDGGFLRAAAKAYYAAGAYGAPAVSLVQRIALGNAGQSATQAATLNNVSASRGVIVTPNWCDTSGCTGNTASGDFTSLAASSGSCSLITTSAGTNIPVGAKIYYCTGGSGSVTYTGTWASAAAWYPSLDVSEWSGVLTSGTPTEGVNTATVLSSSPQTTVSLATSGTLSQASGELIYLWFGAAGTPPQSPKEYPVNGWNEDYQLSTTTAMTNNFTAPSPGQYGGLAIMAVKHQ